MQDRESLSINRSDTSISKSKQLEAAVPPSRISSLSSGEFVGMVADNPDCKIDLKAFHCEVINDNDALNAEIKSYKEIPAVRTITNAVIIKNYEQIKSDVLEIIQSEIGRMMNDPSLTHLIIKKTT